MLRSRLLKSASFSIWLLALAAVIAAIQHQERFFAVDNRPVATLQSKTGQVLVRSEGLVRWQEAGDRHGFLDGDRVATVRASTSRIEFGRGRTLVLGEDTQVQITGILNLSRDYAFMVNLYRGAVVAEVNDKCVRCPELIVKSGSESFTVGKGKKVGLVKKVGQAVKRFNPKEPLPSAAPVAKVALVGRQFLVPEPAVVEPPSPPPSPPPSVAAIVAPKPAVPPPAPTVSAVGYEAAVKQPVQGLVYWAAEPLASLGSAAIDFPVVPPTSRPKQGTWRPALQIAGSSHPGRRDIVAAADPSDQSIRIPLSRLRTVASVGASSGIKEYTVAVRGGGQIVAAGKTSESFNGTPLQVRVRSLAEPVGGPVFIGLDKFSLAPAEAPGGWLAPKKEIRPALAPIGVQLGAAADYDRFLPYIKNAALVGVEAAGPFSNEGIFVVRGQEIVAQIRGSALNVALVRTIQKTLDADFVFKGQRSAFYDTRGKSQSTLVDWVGTLLDKGDVIFVMKRNKIYPVNRDFVKTNNEVATFIDTQAKAIFLQRVDILSAR